MGGIDPVNRLMSEYGLTQTRATAPSSNWFAALRAAKSPTDFHREAKHPYGLSSPRDMGVLLEKIKTGQAVSKGASDQMLQIMRGQLYTAPSEIRLDVPYPTQDRRFSPLHRQ